MKELRQSKIKAILEKKIIFTQEELTEELLKHGIKATQATVSRDIKELMLTKTPVGDGRYRYSIAPEQNHMSQCRIERIFHDCLVAVEYSVNIVMLKTMPGTAQAVAYNIDYLNWPEILGTVGGDDTIFVLIKSVDDVPRIAEKFTALMPKSPDK